MPIMFWPHGPRPDVILVPFTRIPPPDGTGPPLVNNRLSPLPVLVVEVAVSQRWTNHGGILERRNLLFGAAGIRVLLVFKVEILRANQAGDAPPLRAKRLTVYRFNNPAAAQGFPNLPATPDNGQLLGTFHNAHPVDAGWRDDFTRRHVPPGPGGPPAEDATIEVASAHLGYDPPVEEVATNLFDVWRVIRPWLRSDGHQLNAILFLS
jgi:hypothetical protein